MIFVADTSIYHFYMVKAEHNAYIKQAENLCSRTVALLISSCYKTTDKFTKQTRTLRDEAKYNFYLLEYMIHTE